MLLFCEIPISSATYTVSSSSQGLRRLLRAPRVRIQAHHHSAPAAASARRLRCAGGPRYRSTFDIEAQSFDISICFECQYWRIFDIETARYRRKWCTLGMHDIVFLIIPLFFPLLPFLSLLSLECTISLPIWSIILIIYFGWIPTFSALFWKWFLCFIKYWRFKGLEALKAAKKP